MKLKLTKAFKIAFEKQIKYIAEDKPRFALKFRNDILQEIKRAAKKPQQYRRSQYILDSKCRDVIFKGHTIIVREADDFLEVIDIIYMQSFSEGDA